MSFPPGPFLFPITKHKQLSNFELSTRSGNDLSLQRIILELLRLTAVSKKMTAALNCPTFFIICFMFKQVQAISEETCLFFNKKGGCRFRNISGPRGASNLIPKDSWKARASPERFFELWSFEISNPIFRNILESASQRKKWKK